MKCEKCGKVLQLIFIGIEGYKNPVAVKDADGHTISWMVCNNPACEIGKLNFAGETDERITSS
jgi:hypothetical protein